VDRYEVSVDARKGWRVRADVSAGNNPGPAETTEQAVWEFTRLLARPPGWRGMAPLPPSMMLALNYVSPEESLPFATWQSTARWFGEMYRLPDGAQPTVEARALRLGGSGVELVRALRLGGSGVELVDAAGLAARELRYFAVELGWGAYVPRPPETTLQRAFGDCKDKTHVMLALLRSHGVEAYPMLAVASSDQHVPDDLPSPELFNHVVVAIPWSGLERRPGMAIIEDPELGTLRLYDTTLPASSPQDLPMDLQGGAGLVLHPRTSRVARLPGSDVKENVLSQETELRVQPDGALQVSTTLRVHGLMRRMLEGEARGTIDAKQLRRFVFHDIASTNPEIRGLSIADVREESDGAWAYDVSYESPRGLADFGELKLLELEPVAPIGLVPTPREDADVIYLPFRGVFRDSLKLTLDGWRVAGHVGSLKVENALGSVELDVEADETGMRLRRTLTLASNRLPGDKLDEVLEIRNALRQLNGVALIFERTE
jgi:hypothetical protein